MLRALRHGSLQILGGSRASFPPKDPEETRIAARFRMPKRKEARFSAVSKLRRLCVLRVEEIAFSKGVLAKLRRDYNVASRDVVRPRAR